ncbi:FAD-dependent oxidoreductase [Nitrobacteraceae bacterium UC4446_H13]
MSVEDRVFVAGAGPIGMVAAANLAMRGVPVTVFEASPTLSSESRASTFHPPTLDMLDKLGVADDLIKEGLMAPTVQYRSKAFGAVAQFDFGDIADVTDHPYRLQSEQFKLTRIIQRHYQSNPNFRVEFSHAVKGVEQIDGGVRVEIEQPNGATIERTGRWLIGADGARSTVRKSVGLEFEGFTWPERFLVISTPFDFRSTYPDLASVTYVADPKQWFFLLRIPGMWRAMVPIDPEVPDDIALSEAFATQQLESIAPGAGQPTIIHLTLYRVHQRVAASFRRDRVFLAGDAAHINNPLGGMGMNGGIHDAFSLTNRLAGVWHFVCDESALDGYDRERRLVTLEHVQRQTIENKRNLEAATDAEHRRYCEDMQKTAADKARSREFLLRISMIKSLERAAEFG